MYYIVGGRLIRKIVMKETDEDKGIVGKKQLFVQYMVKL